ncbi:MAG: aminotransferase class V-fold PLP-dependent enzyme [Acetobacteraceae bacterium]
MKPGDDIRARLGLRPIINVSGTITALGASIVVPEAAAAVAAILGEFVEIPDLQRKASAAITAATGAKAGFVTASCSAAVTLAIAGAMTGEDLAAIERLPDTNDLKNEVAIQLGHMINYGAPIEQAIRIAGARPVPVGQATEVQPYQLSGVLGPRTAAVLFVISQDTVPYGQLSLEEVVALAAGSDVPVIVDAASEYDLRGFLARGADVVCYSAQKSLGGPAAGIVAGETHRVRAAYLQKLGIGRAMLVGKEGIAGTIAALEAWRTRDHAAIRAREAAALRLWQGRLVRFEGVAASIAPDPTGNPLDRLRVSVDPARARITAWDLADALAAGNPPVIVRDNEVEHGYIQLDPCNLHPGEEKIVADRLDAELVRAGATASIIATSLAARRERRIARLLRWPD